MTFITRNFDELFKRLLMLNQLGVYIYGRDGHRWIACDVDIEHPLVLDHILLNSKFYGGVIEVLDTIDEALRRDGQDDLYTRWVDWGMDVLPLGNGGIAESRIDVVKSGQGGIN